MSEILDETGEDRLGIGQKSADRMSPPLETITDTEDSVFTVWSTGEKDNEVSSTREERDVKENVPFLQYDPYTNVSPSPQDFNANGYTRQLSSSSDLTAALQTEKEFLNFVSSLPQVQKVNKDTTSSPSDVEADKNVQKPTDVTVSKPAPVVTTASHVGLNHLDNLCRMIEQLKELREQNNRLQKRVHYLEDVKALQDMQNEMSMGESNFGQLFLANLNLSASELRLEEIPESPLFRRDSDESLDSFTSGKKIEIKDELLDLPPDTIQLRSSSDDDSRRTESTETPSAAGKEKKMPKTTWGKVKNIINYNKKETVRKKTQSLDPPSRKRARAPRAMSTTSPKISPKTYREPTAISDPEEYDIDCEPYDGDGSSWDLDGDGETGLWINPKKTDFPPEYFFGKENVPRDRRKKKPHLTITVPSCEDVSLHNVITVEPLAHREGVGKISPESTGSSKDRKHSPNYSTTPPSPRRTSHWSKVKQAFLTGHNQTIAGRQTQKSKTNNSYSSPPNSPAKRPETTSFNFDASILKSGYAEDGFSSELSPSLSIDKSRVDESSPTATHGLQKNLLDLQKTLTGEFTKKLCEWEKLKKTTGQDYSPVQRLHHDGPYGLPQPDHIPFQFRKKMDDWDKAKLKERDKAGISMTSVLQKDLKTKNYEEETLPPEFKKKLTEWQIRKALVGKCERNVEEIQKNLGEDFNKKMAEWERMKAQAKATVESDIGEVPLDRCRQPLSTHVESPSSRGKNRAGFPVGAKLTSLAGAAGIGAGSLVLQSSLDRKGSSQKLKKAKAKEDKLLSMKSENIPKTRNKELQWLEKELGKIDREKQRLEREKDKFIEREARLEKMRYAMKERQPETKEIYIKTSTGEFRFEGISQTFTKKLYEWEERRGIRPESSTFLLLDPNYKAPGETAVEDKPKTPEPKRIVKSRSESSLAERAVASIHSNASTSSLNEDKDDVHALQIESKAASEPTLPTEESILERQVIGILAPKEEFSNSMAPDVALPPEEVNLAEGNEVTADPTLQHSPPYAPDEITRLIDSSESEERYRFAEHDGIWTSVPNKHCYVQRTDSVKSEEDYRNLLHENMTLLGQLKEKENVCRAIESQMGDLDNKMDTVADQHIRTLERLHRQVNIMRKSESFGNPPTGESYFEESESERNRVLITQLKSRIAELEEKGDRLMADKEELECAFNLHKEQETQIAESLLLRIRELQEAGAEVNIQTVQCQTDDLEINESHETSDENKGSFESHDFGVSVKKKRRRRREEAKCEQRCLIDDESEDERVLHRRSNKDQKDGRRKRRPPPRNVQKLHNLTADLLFQAKRLEQGIIAKHNLCESGHKKIRRNDSLEKHIIRNRSLKTQRSLRFPTTKDSDGSWPSKCAKFGSGASKNWSSIEAIGTEKVSDQWENKASAILFESQDLLKMNSDLTRMARELRKEMTNIWSFKDSTSESNSSDNRIGHIDSRMDKNLTKLEKEDVKLEEEETWLAKQATEVFKSIASLQSEKTLWPSSRELSLDEEAVKLSVKKESSCSTTDEFNITENRSVEYYNSDERSINTQPEENKIRRRGSSLSEKNYIEREGTFLDDNFCFTEESAIQPQLINRLDHQIYEYEIQPNLYSGLDSTDNQDLRPILSDISEKEQDIGNQHEYSPTLGVNPNNNNVVVRRFKVPKISPYETEVSQLRYQHISPGRDLRTRRVSDSQIDYSNFSRPKLQKSAIQINMSSTIPYEMVNKSSSFKRNQSANDVPLLQNIDSNVEDSNIFVPTKRTVFTVIDNDGCISQVKKSIIENETDDDNGANEKSSTEIVSHEENLDDSKVMEEDLSKDYNVGDSSYDSADICEKIRRYNDPVLNKNQQVLLLSDLQNQSENKTGSLQLCHSAHSTGTPLCYKSFPRRNGHSVDNSKSKGFKAVIDIFNNRITRNQQLLMNPFAMGDPFIEVKRRQALSSDYIDVINSEQNVDDIFLGLHLHRDKTPGKPALNLDLQESNPIILEKFSANYQENANRSINDSTDLEETTLKCRKTQLKKAKEDFFQEMLKSGNNAISTDQIASEVVESCVQKKLHQHKPPPSESRSVACQIDEMSVNRESYTSTSDGSPQKPPRNSLCGVDFRADGNTQQKADRHSLLSNLANTKISKSIMKIFKKEKFPERRCQSAIEVLCRHSLNVNVPKSNSAHCRTSSTDQVPQSSRQRLASEAHGRDHAPATLPRGWCTSATSTSSNSCPPTPYVQQKSKSTSWFERSRKILKGKAQSPEKKSR